MLKRFSKQAQREVLSMKSKAFISCLVKKKENRSYNQCRPWNNWCFSSDYPQYIAYLLSSKL